jgi:AcrR family transcriptional regulator
VRVKTEDRRQAIMQAALSLFREVGYERASMSEIAARLGGSKATLYGYFPSREELFAAAMLEEPLGQTQDMLATLDPANDDIESVLVAFGKAYLRFHSTPNLVDGKRNALAQGAHSTLGPIIYERGPRATCRKVAAYLEVLMARGVVRRADPEIATLHLWGLLEAGVVEPGLFGVDPLLTIDEAAALAVKVFLAAYAAR